MEMTVFVVLCVSRNCYYHLQRPFHTTENTILYTIDRQKQNNCGSLKAEVRFSFFESSKNYSKFKYVGKYYRISHNSWSTFTAAKIYLCELDHFDTLSDKMPTKVFHSSFKYYEQRIFVVVKQHIQKLENIFFWRIVGKELIIEFLLPKQLYTNILQLNAKKQVYVLFKTSFSNYRNKGRQFDAQMPKKIKRITSFS